jgi:hypothetical protein
MRDHLMAEVAARRGVITRAQALAVTPHHVLDRAVSAGVLLRVFPRTYVAALLVDDEKTLARAAALSTGGALSHVTALRFWSLPGIARPLDIHITIGREFRKRGCPGLVVHRRHGFSLGAPHTVMREGISVVRLESAVIESWQLLPAWERRTPAIVAVRERRTTSSRLLAELESRPACGNVPEQRRLLTLISQGCHSELELWGMDQVFDHAYMPLSKGQHRVVIRGRSAYLDRAFLTEMVDVEMDGVAYHFLPGQRERDMERDAALAALGWLVVRFSWRRLHADPAACRLELLQILAARRTQLGIRSA